MPKTAKMETYKDKKGEWRWRLVAANGKVVADSGEGYSSHRRATTAKFKLSTILREALANEGIGE